MKKRRKNWPCISETL